MQVRIAHHNVGGMDAGGGVFHTPHGAVRVMNSMGWRFGENFHPQACCQSLQMKGDGAHSTLWEIGSNPVFEVWNDVQHGRGAMWVAAIVSGVSVEELSQFRMPEFASVVVVQAAHKGQAPKARQQFPCCSCFVCGSFMQAALQEHPPRQFESGLASLQVLQQASGRHAPTSLDVLGETFRICPGDERLIFILPEVMGAPIQGFVGESIGPCCHIRWHQIIQFFHQLRHGEQGRATIKSVAAVLVLSELSTNCGGTFQHGDAMSTSGHAHCCGKPSNTSANHDDVAGLCHAGIIVDKTSGKQILNHAV